MSRIFATILILSVCGSTLPQEYFSIHETPENIMSHGYVAERHHVNSGGYTLEMHRIPYRRYEQEASANRPVVFLMHGVTAASNSFIILGPEYSIGYHLADAGFDVWMGNARGTRNSRVHEILDPDDPVERFEFFDFTWEEIGVEDLPAMIDYILNATGKDKLHYIGHSQGGTVFLVMASMLPEYNDKLASVHLLAGVGYQNYFPDQQLVATAALTDVIYNLALTMGIVEVDGINVTEIIQGGYSRSDYCFGDINLKEMCRLIGMRAIMRDDGPIYESGGAALKQIAHYGQNIRDREFRRWNFGRSANNIENYGSESPPVYDLSLITANVTMHYTVNDALLDERDVLAMAADMPNTVVRRVARDTFLHEDFVAAIDAKELVTDYIIEMIASVEGFGEEEENPTDGQEPVVDSPVIQPGTEDQSTDSASNISLSIILLASLLLHVFGHV